MILLLLSKIKLSLFSAIGIELPTPMSLDSHGKDTDQNILQSLIPTLSQCGVSFRNHFIIRYRFCIIVFCIICCINKWF